MKTVISFLFVLAFGLSSFAQSDVKLVFGNPSNALADTSQADNYLLTHTGYILSYNRSRGSANWVAWHLSASDLGDAARSNTFAPDQTLPRDWWIRPNDYKRSGYDQGHLCPSEDRTANDEVNKETFLMSNMVPQVGRMNRVTWKSLEAYTQKSVRGGKEAYIYAGCYGDKGAIKDKITVPTNCYKIVVFLEEGSGDLKRVNGKTEIVAVDIPNDETVKNRWQSYRATIDAIEEKTGYDFLLTLPDEIEELIERK